jgi:hypothetical protein
MLKQPEDDLESLGLPESFEDNPQIEFLRLRGDFIAKSTSILYRYCTVLPYQGKEQISISVFNFRDLNFESSSGTSTASPAFETETMSDDSHTNTQSILGPLLSPAISNWTQWPMGSWRLGVNPS